MKVCTVGTLGVAALLVVSGCHSQHPSTVATPTVHATSVATSSTAPTPNPASLVLSLDELNTIAQQADPNVPVFDSFDPSEMTPRVPNPGPTAICDKVNPLYFASGDPAPSRYFSQWAATSMNRYLSQDIAVYDSPATAAEKFSALAEGIPICAKASTSDANIPFTVTSDISSPDVIRYTWERKPDPTVPGTNSHVTPEFRLVGPAIVAVSSGESATAVTAVADKIVSKLK